MALMLQSTPGQKDWKVTIAMDRSIAHTTTKDDKRIVKNLRLLES